MRVTMHPSSLVVSLSFLPDPGPTNTRLFGPLRDESEVTAGDEPKLESLCLEKKPRKR